MVSCDCAVIKGMVALGGDLHGFMTFADQKEGITWRGHRQGCMDGLLAIGYVDDLCRGSETT